MPVAFAGNVILAVAVLTCGVLFAAEAGHSPVRAGEAAPEEVLLVIPSVHMDIDFVDTPLNSLELYDRQILTALDELDKSSSGTFNVEHVMALAHFLESHPEQTERVKAHLASGRLEISAAWTNPHFADLSGELMLRQVAEARWYLRRRLSYEALTIKTGELADVTPQLAQVLRQSGVNIFQTMKSGSGFPRGPWCLVALDGTKAFCLEQTYWATLAQLPARIAPRKTSPPAGVAVQFAGVDDDVPPLRETAELIAKANDRYGADGKWRARFGTLTEYARLLQAADARGELALPQCCLHSDHGECLYLWHSSTKYIDRSYIESKLSLYETVSALVELLGGAEYDREAIGAIWRSALEVSTHNWGNTDVQKGGTGVFDKWMAEGAAELRRRLGEKVRELSSLVGYREGASPIFVFNGANWPRSEPVSVTLEGFAGPSVKVADDAGAQVPAEVTPLAGGGALVTFIARDVPGIGYRTFFFHSEPSTFESDLVVSDTSVENAFYRITFEPGRGVTSIVDKVADRELADTSKMAFGEILPTIRDMEWPPLDPSTKPPLTASPQEGELRNVAEWLEAYKAYEIEALAIESAVIERKGPLRAIVSVRQGGTRVDFTLYAGQRLVEVVVSGGPEELRHVAFPLKFDSIADCRTHIPYGSAPLVGGEVRGDEGLDFSRATKGVPKYQLYYNEPWHGAIFRPENYPEGGKRAKASWVHLTDGRFGITYAMEDCYASLFKTGNTLIKIVRPDRTNRFFFTSGSPGWQEAPRFGFAASSPLVAVEPPSAGSLPEKALLLGVTSGGAVATAFKKADDGDGWALRFYEAADRDGEVRVSWHPALPVAAIRRSNAIEESLEPLSVDGHAAGLPVRGFEIVTLRLR